jgi:hypothetical protein
MSERTWELWEQETKVAEPAAGPAQEKAAPPVVASETTTVDIKLEPALAALSEVLAPGERVSVFDLPRTRVPPGGGLEWEIDGERIPEIVGVIVHRHPVRVYWPTPVPQKGTPPSCYSLDLLMGHGEPGGSCQDCPYAQWGSAVGPDGKPRAGQACKVVNRLFIMRPGEALPLFLPLPPTAHRPMERYLLRLASRGLRLWEVVTGISLQRTQSREGLTYSEPVFRISALLAERTRELVRALRHDLISLLEGRPTEAEAEIVADESEPS